MLNVLTLKGFKISEYLNDYAFIIESFDYNFDNDSLNFRDPKVEKE